MRRYSPEHCALYSQVHLCLIGKFLWNLGFSHSYKVGHVSGCVSFTCVRPTRFLHAIVSGTWSYRHGGNVQLPLKVWVRIKEQGGLFPRTLVQSLMCKRRAMEAVLSEIVEQISKIHCSVCTVVWYLKDGLTSLEFLLVTKSNEELHHKYLDLKIFIWTQVLIASFPLRGKKRILILQLSLY